MAWMGSRQPGEQTSQVRFHSAAQAGQLDLSPPPSCSNNRESATVFQLVNHGSGVRPPRAGRCHMFGCRLAPIQLRHRHPGFIPGRFPEQTRLVTPRRFEKPAPCGQAALGRQRNLCSCEPEFPRQSVQGNLIFPIPRRVNRNQRCKSALRP